MRICSQVNHLLPCGKWLTPSLRVVWKLFLSFFFSLYGRSLLNLIIIHLKSEDVLSLNSEYPILSVYKIWRWLKVGKSVGQVYIVKFYVIQLFYFIFFPLFYLFPIIFLLYWVTFGPSFILVSLNFYPIIIVQFASLTKRLVSSLRIPFCFPCACTHMVRECVRDQESQK